MATAGTQAWRSNEVGGLGERLSASGRDQSVFRLAAGRARCY